MSGPDSMLARAHETARRHLEAARTVRETHHTAIEQHLQSMVKPTEGK